MQRYPFIINPPNLSKKKKLSWGVLKFVESHSRTTEETLATDLQMRA